MGPSSPSPRAYIGVAAVCLAIAGLLIWAGWTRDAALREPAPVAYAAAIIFLLAALRSFQLALAPRSPGNGVAALLMATAAAVEAWIAFGPGNRVCSVASGWDEVARVSGLTCRIPFGVGALLTALMAGYAARRWLRARATT